MRVAAVVVIGCALWIAGPWAQQPARDTAPQPRQGTATVSGVVVIDGPDSRPARGAVVTLNHTDGTFGDTAVTDEQGRFEFRGVPAGRYHLAAEKAGFVRARFGATRPGRAGTPIAVADGQRVTNTTLRLSRGAVISGTVRDANGEPAPGVAIRLMRVTTTGGSRRATDFYTEWNDGTTDDRGVYRRFGLPPGDYILQVRPATGNHEGASSSAMMTTTLDVAWARIMLSSPTGAGAPAPPPPPARTSMGYAPVYYPNTLQQSAAAVITLGAGEERAGLDFTLSLFPTFRVSGVVTSPDGSPLLQPPGLYLVELGGNAGGWYGIQESRGATFAFDGVAPGAYAVAAIMEDTKMWAIADVTVAGQDQAIALTLQPGLTAPGQVVFQGTRPAPRDLTHVVVYTSAVSVAGGVAVEPTSVDANADGTFAITGLIPGSYRIMAALPEENSPAGDGWVLRSAMVGTQDVADLPLEVRAGADVGKIVVTFTDRPTELSGRLQDASGRPASEYFIIVFSPDERTWWPQSRRIVQTRPASDGHFAVRGLPPGEYLIAALTDVERDEWYDAGFLRQLVPASIKVTLGEGEKKVQDIQIRSALVGVERIR